MTTALPVLLAGSDDATKNPSPYQVSIIIVNYNSGEALLSCVDSLLAQNYPNYEVIVVDNGSTDGSPDRIEKEYPWVTLIKNSSNSGYGHSNNLGAQVAKGKILAFLNPDAEADQNWLDSLVTSFQQYPQAGLVTSRIVITGSESIINSAGNQIHFTGLSFCRGLGESSDHYMTPEWGVSVSGAGFAVRREVFDDIEGFDSLLFLYHDDVDLSLRSRLAGHQCLYAPSCVVKHAFTLRLPPEKWLWVEQNRYAVLIKSLRWRTLLVLLPALVLVEILTWSYLASKGAKYLMAKAQSYWWLADNLNTLLQHRALVQAKRRVSDRQLLHTLSVRVPFRQILSERASALVNGFVNTVFAGMFHAATVLVRW